METRKKKPAPRQRRAKTKAKATPDATAEFFKALAPAITTMVSRLDQKFQIDIERDKVRLAQDQLDFEQKRRFGIPSREKLELALEMEALELRRRAARDEAGSKALVAEAEVVETFLAGTTKRAKRTAIKRKKEDANAA